MYNIEYAYYSSMIYSHTCCLQTSSLILMILIIIYNTMLLIIISYDIVTCSHPTLNHHVTS